MKKYTTAEARALAQKKLGEAYDAVSLWIRMEKDRALQRVAEDAIHGIDGALADLLAQNEPQTGRM